MDAYEYLSTIVAPTIKEYALDRASVRRGFLACVTTFHTIDYMAGSKRPRVIRDEVRRECPSFVLIDRVAHAFKHASTGREGGSIDPLKPEWVQSRPPAILGEMLLGASILGDGVGDLNIGGAAGTDLYQELLKVQAYFEARLAHAQG